MSQAKTTPTLNFLHTSPVHVATFENLLSELAPTLPARHLVQPELLAQARAEGQISALALAIRKSLTALLSNTEIGPVVLCTCSSIGNLAEIEGAKLGLKVIRVDRPMCTKALVLGPRIAVVAALESTFQPTLDLLRQEATRLNLDKPPQLELVFCEGAWAHFEAGDQEAYWQSVADKLHQLDGLTDTVVLAQASMAGATAYATLKQPVLSSPRLGLQAALKMYWALN